MAHMMPRRVRCRHRASPASRSADRNVVRQPHAVALEVAGAHSGSSGGTIPRLSFSSWCSGCEATPRGDDLRHALQLLASDRRLDVGHAVVVADLGMRLEDHLWRGVAHGVGNAHAVLAKPAETGGPSRHCRQHAAVAGADDLARMEREAGDVAVRLADFLPPAVPQRISLPMAQAASSISGQAVAPRTAGSPQVAGHADLVHAEDRPRARRDGGLDSSGSMLKVVGLDVDEHRRAPQ